MEIKKATEAVSSGMPTALQLEAINAQAKATLTAEQVYVFSLRLCDDQVDRDCERFDTADRHRRSQVEQRQSGGTNFRHGSGKERRCQLHQGMGIHPSGRQC